MEAKEIKNIYKKKKILIDQPYGVTWPKPHTMLHNLKAGF